jgi:hypothetical protein
MSITVTSSTRRPGRPRRCPLHVLVRVVELREAGALLKEVCEQLNTEGVPTPGGGTRWWPSHVHRLLGTYDAQQLADGREVDGQRIWQVRQLYDVRAAERPRLLGDHLDVAGLDGDDAPGQLDRGRGVSVVDERDEAALAVGAPD